MPDSAWQTWRIAVQSRRWRPRRLATIDCRRCAWCGAALDRAQARLFADEYGAILLCVCSSCEQHLTVIPERRRESPVDEN